MKIKECRKSKFVLYEIEPNSRVINVTFEEMCMILKRDEKSVWRSIDYGINTKQYTINDCNKKKYFFKVVTP